jgi:hypothetical protein
MKGHAGGRRPNAERTAHGAKPLSASAAPRTAWIDCAGGVAGDMLLAACLDALARRDGGDPVALASGFLRGLIRRLRFSGTTVRAAEVRRGGFRGLHLEVRVDPALHPAERSLAEVLALLARARLPQRAKERATAVFRRLAEAEALAHGVPLRRAHLHEVGAVDAVVDVAGTCAALELLGVERLACSVLPIGTGTVRCTHGELPLPAPAVAQLVRGLPVRGVAVEGETVTPTGAALVAELAGTFGALPPMIVDAVGVGAGRLDRSGIANLTRLFVGRPQAEAARPAPAGDVLVEANIDDMTPDLFEHAFERLFEAGALDVFVTPILMKKGRPAHKLTALVEGAKVEAVVGALFRETTSIGCRLIPVEKRALERVSVDVRTPWGRVPVKLSLHGGEIVGRRPEHDVCRRIARKTGLPLRAVIEAVTAAARDVSLPRRHHAG